MAKDHFSYKMFSFEQLVYWHVILFCYKQYFYSLSVVFYNNNTIIIE